MPKGSKSNWDANAHESQLPQRIIAIMGRMKEDGVREQG
jgi:hypothetical protein